MPCTPIEQLTEKPDILAELTYQLERLRLIEAPEDFIKGFQFCYEFIDEYLNPEE